MTSPFSPVPGLLSQLALVRVTQDEAGVVQVRLSGACASCASSMQATILAVEDELRKRVPEVEYLEAVP